jgi:thiamine phosphate synthase YjbQ (UPF0047 family)
MYRLKGHTLEFLLIGIESKIWRRRESGIREGSCLVNTKHISASVFIYDAESGLQHDYTEWLESLVHHEPVDSYWHNRTGEEKPDAHHKRQVMVREVVVAITEERLDFGPWEQIFMASSMDVVVSAYW